MKVDDRVRATTEIKLYDPNTMLLDMIVPSDHLGTIIKDVTKTMPNGNDYRVLVVKFDGSEVVHVTGAKTASETIKPA